MASTVSLETRLPPTPGPCGLPREVWYNLRMRKRPLIAWTGILVLAAAVSCGGGPKPLSPEDMAELEAWRAQRLARLTAEDGWLTLIGLHWLAPGAHRFGSSDGCEIVLPDPNIPPVAGEIVLRGDGSLLLRSLAPGAVTVNNLQVTSTPLADDAGGSPDVVRTGRISFYAIRRGDRLGLRIKDPEAPTRKNFKGLEYYPPDGRYRTVAHLERYHHPRPVKIATVIGTEEELLAPGVLRFRLLGRDLSLVPLVEHPGDTELFLVFRDATSGTATYGAGRFLSATLEPDGTAVLDFNRAYNPPCAFTPYATCPLPPPENALPIPVEAGEKLPPGTSHH